MLRKATLLLILLLTAAPACAGAYEDLMSSAISAWAVPGQIDTPNDSKGVNNGVWSGTEAYTDGPFGRAFSFDGSSDINCGDVYTMAADSSVTLFLRARWDVSATDTFAYLGGQSSAFLVGFNIKFQNATDAGGFVGSNNGTVGGNIGVTTKGVWHPVVIRYDEGTQTARYRIGDETDTVAANATGVISPEFYIGSRDGVGRSLVDISEVAVWDRSLSDSEIDDLVAGPTPGPAPAVVHNYNTQLAR